MHDRGAACPDCSTAAARRENHVEEAAPRSDRPEKPVKVRRVMCDCDFRIGIFVLPLVLVLVLVLEFESVEYEYD
jgi:hypothetical protein